jgi:hypothetical protein
MTTLYLLFSKRNESASTTRVKLLAKEMNGTDDDTEEDAIEIRRHFYYYTGKASNDLVLI